MKGNEAIAEAAIRAGCRAFFGYPITPQTELPEYLVKHMPEAGGVFLQAESEVAAINMVYGAAGAGVRTMTSSSSPGISLKAEGISYIAGAELPCVIVNIVRGGPGLGGIQPAQSDYFQAVKGGGHGDFKLVVYAPWSVQEAVTLTMKAFDTTDYYRNPVMILGDGILGQMMEAVEFPEAAPLMHAKPWATTGMKGRKPNIINSLYLKAEELEEHNYKLGRKYADIIAREQMSETYLTEDAEYIIVAFGSLARIAKAGIDIARSNGIKVGLFRPVTLWPYPEVSLSQLCEKTKAILVAELNMGQMVEDVRLAVNGRLPVKFYGRPGGVIPSAEELASEIAKLAGEVL